MYGSNEGVQSQEAHHLQAPSEQAEKQTDAAINNAEVGMAIMFEKIRPKINKIKNEHLKTSLLQPFTVISENQGNLQKNYYHLPLPASEINYLRENANHFNYKAAKVFNGYAASFKPSTRTLLITPEFDFNNQMDLLTLYHEIIHVKHDEIMRTAFTENEKIYEYSKFLGRVKKPYIFMEDEIRAMFLTLKMADLVLGDRLSKAATEGEILNTEEIRLKLGARKSQKEAISLLIHLSKQLFSNYIEDDYIPAEFAHEMLRLYKKTNYHILHFDGTKIKKYNK
jgi:hypothetical protein